MLSIAGHGITNHPRSKTLRAHASVALTKRLLETGWTNKLIDSVSWTAVQKGTEHYPKSIMTTLVKHMNGMLPIGHRLTRVNSCASSKCTRCKTVEESDWHLLSCAVNAPSGRDIRKKFEKNLGKAKFNKEIVSLITHFLFDMRLDKAQPARPAQSLATSDDCGCRLHGTGQSGVMERANTLISYLKLKGKLETAGKIGARCLFVRFLTHF